MMKKASSDRQAQTADNAKKADTQYSVTGLLSKISNGGESGAYKALVELRTKILKQSDGVARIRQRGGVQILLDFLSKQSDNKKIQDVCLSVLGNCCVEEKFRAEVLQRDGVDILNEIMFISEEASIKNRASRTLANLAQGVLGCTAIHNTEGLVECIIETLRDGSDTDCQQTHVRTIRLISDTKAHCITVLNERGLKLVADLLTSDSTSVQQAAYKTVVHFVQKHPTEQCALQLNLAEVPKFLLETATNKTPSFNPRVEDLILTMSKHECFRPGLGNAGSIPYFIQQIDDKECGRKQTYMYLNALCLSCKESLNRVRIREAGGLKLLVTSLETNAYHNIHNRIISALLCFLYDETSFQILLDCDMVSILMSHLSRSVPEQKSQFINEDITRSIEELLSEVVITESSPHSNEEYSDTEAEAENMKTDKHKGENDDFKAPLAIDPTESNLPEDEETNQSGMRRNVTKYSMDSPTYKEISEGSVGDLGYDPSGPRNLLECQEFGGTSFGYSSPPLSLSSYGSPEPFSPLSNTSGYLSPDWSPPSSPTRPLSPIAYDFPTSPISGLTTSSSTSNFAASSTSSMGQFSPLGPVPYASPSKSPRSSPFFNEEISNKDTPEYSSEEDTEEENTVKSEDCKTQAASSIDSLKIGKNADSKGETCYFVRVKEELEADETVSKPDAKNDNSNVETCSFAPIKEEVEMDEAEAKIVKTLSESSFGTDNKNITEKVIKSEQEETDAKLLSSDAVTETNILVFLSRVSYMEKPQPYLLKTTIIEGLVNYLLYATRFVEENWNRAQRILLRILKDPTYLDFVLAEGLLGIVSIKCNLSKSEMKTEGDSKEWNHSKGVDIEREVVNAVSAIAQDNFGQGVLTHVLKKWSSTQKMKAFLCIPLIYRDPEVMARLMKQMPAGLSLIVHGLDSSSQLLSMACVSFLTHLSQVCSMGKPSHHRPSLKRKRSDATQPEKKLRLNPDTSSPAMNLEEKDAVVTFQLPEGICSSPSKNALSLSSPVFSAMFKGSFSESAQSVIKIEDVPTSAFQTLVQCMNCLEESQSVLNGLSLKSLLQLLVLCHRYMVHDLEQMVSQTVRRKLEKDETSSHDKNDDVVKTLKTALLHNSCHLVEYCLSVLLDSRKLLQERCEAMSDCFNLNRFCNANLLSNFNLFLVDFVAKF